MNRFLLSPGSRRLSARFIFSYICLAFVVSFITYASLIRPVVTLTDDNAPAPFVYEPVPAMSRRSTSGNRAYMEYSLDDGSSTSKTCGILRQQVMYVYSKPGETICLGSDILYSHIDTDEQFCDEPTGADIVVIAPNGDVTVFDTTPDKGYIGSCAQEQAGADYLGLNPDGYTPHYYEPKEKGVYEIRFHSYSGMRNTQPVDNVPHFPSKDKNDPNPIAVDDDSWKNTGCTVGAYDITVVDKETKTVKTGRTYTYYLSLNMGNNSTAALGEIHFTDKYYVVTTDGYIYLADFDLDPFGFVFFANNRGVTDDDGNSRYRSYKSGNNDLKIKSDYTVYLHNPSMSDTDIYKSYRIFTEKPSDELIGTEIPLAYEPETITDVKFVGARGENTTYKGYGGYFTFNVKNAISVGVSIDFSEYNQNHGTQYTNVSLRSSVIPGENKVFWDGRDGDGEVVDVGIYSDSDVKISVNAYVGEVHFPLLDVENCYSFMITRINDVYDIETGMKIDTENNDSYDKNIYYDNSTHNDPQNNKYYQNIVVDGYENIIADGLDNSDGTTEPLSFDGYYLYHYTDDKGKYSTPSRFHGDFATLDIWKYFYKTSEVSLTKSKDFIIIDIDGYDSASVSAYVFYDNLSSHYFRLSEGDYGLEGVKVTLDYHYYETRWNLVKDEEDNIICYDPLPVTVPTYDEEGIQTGWDTIAYYHNYRIVPTVDNKGAVKYAVYKWDENDRLHEDEPVFTKKYADFKLMELAVEDAEAEPGQTTQTVYEYVFVIPVHMETFTDQTGYYCFDGLLFNTKDIYMASWYVKGMPPHNRAENHPKYSGLATRYKNLVISVINPDPALYGTPTTTGKVHQSNSGADKEINFAVPGNDNTCGNHTISLASVDREIYYEKQAAGIDGNGAVSLKTANVGYHYDLYQPPLTVRKQWSDDFMNSDITSMDITIAAFDENDIRMSDGYKRTVTVTNVGSWKTTLTTLPYIPEGCTYKTVSEEFVYDGYTYIYYSSGTYECRDLSGNQVNRPYPFKTTFEPIDKNNTEDILTVNNNSKDSTFVTITKLSKRDTSQHLPLAYFKLYIKSGENWVPYTVGGNPCEAPTDENGSLTFHGLVRGTYKLTEVNPPTGFARAGEIEFDVGDYDCGTTPEYQYSGSIESGYSATVYDYPEDYDFNAKIEITKLNPDGKKLQGAGFAVYAAHEQGSSKYYIASKAGDDQGKYNISLDGNGSAFIDITVSESERGTYTTDENGVITTTIAGDTYTIEPVKTQITDENGIALFTKLDPGKYMVREIKAPAGYNAITSDIFVNAPEDKLMQETVEDTFISFNMNLIKTNNQNERLNGARFVLYYETAGNNRYYHANSGEWAEAEDENDVIFTVSDEAQNETVISGMVYDRQYFLQEKEAPEGFKTLDEPVAITLTPDGYTAKYKNRTFPLTLSEQNYSLTVPNDYLNNADLKKTVLEDSTNTYGAENSVEMGQNCEYKLEVSFDRTDKSVVISDDLPEGIVLNSDSISIKERGKTEELPRGNYTIEFNKDTHDFVITLDNSYLQTIPADTLTTLDITYSALTTKTASCGEDGNVNTACLTTNKGKKTATATTYIYDLIIYKYTCQSGSPEPLEGAKFVIINNDGKFGSFSQRRSDGVYLLNEWVDSAEDAQPLESPENGYIKAAGLDIDTYTLREVEAPEGYYTADDITIRITKDAIICKRGEGDETIAANRTVDVENHIVVILPMTGGSGTKGIYIIGFAIMLASMAGILVKTRKRE